jgi:hypothetical protein
MSGTRRIPINRRSVTAIAPRAVELYKAMRRIRCTCPLPKPGRNAPSMRDQCRGCSKWWSLHSELDAALGPTKPWLWPHLAEPTRVLHPDGSIRPQLPAQHMRETEQRLKAAARDMRAQRRNSVLHGEGKSDEKGTDSIRTLREVSTDVAADGESATADLEPGGPAPAPDA